MDMDMKIPSDEVHTPAIKHKQKADKLGIKIPQDKKRLSAEGWKRQNTTPKKKAK